jgi:hypothetical protein
MKVEEMLDVANPVGLKLVLTWKEIDAILSQPKPRLCSANEAMGFAAFMGKAMPTGQGTDFDIWAKDASLIFTEYPYDDVRLAVEHPSKGIRAFNTWLPDPKTLIEFLQAMQERRGRIRHNAQEVGARIFEDMESKEKPSPEQQAEMSRRIQNIVRGSRGRCSIEEDVNRRNAQERVNAYAEFCGNGDASKGFEIMMERGMVSPPDDWKPEPGWNGGIA